MGIHPLSCFIEHFIADVGSWASPPVTASYADHEPPLLLASQSARTIPQLIREKKKKIRQSLFDGLLPPLNCQGGNLQTKTQGSIGPTWAALPPPYPGAVWRFRLVSGKGHTSTTGPCG